MSRQVEQKDQYQNACTNKHIQCEYDEAEAPRRHAAPAPHDERDICRRRCSKDGHDNHVVSALRVPEHHPRSGVNSGARHYSKNARNFRRQRRRFLQLGGHGLKEALDRFVRQGAARDRTARGGLAAGVSKKRRRARDRVLYVSSARRTSLVPSGPVIRNQSPPGEGSHSRANVKNGQQRRSSTIQRATEIRVSASFGRRRAQPLASSRRSSVSDSRRRPSVVCVVNDSREAKADGSHATGSRCIAVL
jgi:hypothetical protein